MGLLNKTKTLLYNKFIIRHIRAVYYSLHNSWHNVYKHNGGMRSMLSCIVNSAAFVPVVNSTQSASGIDIVTFSVVPGLTTAWNAAMEATLQHTKHSIYIGDCSGGIRKGFTDNTRVRDLYNFKHDKKLDLYIRYVCDSEYVVVSDDDVFWLSSAAIDYALEKMQQDDKCAVVSFMPRDITSSLLAPVTDKAMGSFCLLIRRSIWIKEKLSFRVVLPPPELNSEWFYDTADYANKLLIERGYTVHIAPEEIRSNIMAIEGASTWTLKIHRNKGDIDSQLANIPLRVEKAYTVILFLDAIGEILATKYNDQSLRHPIIPQYAETARKQCEAQLTEEAIAAIRKDVDTKIASINATING